ncbi:serine protease [Sporosarcina sp. P37]|uniref:CAP domain-containing protein n=1 Tax=unclassified Sporosarcina TaxID=2647733 RepID=UPI000A17D9EB|nr:MULTISPECIES: CAP-associated domain-containing protein [unclassified Sporosarcina]ARK25101.1 serine protease [Sporosarcina sp. P37]
MIKRLFQLLFLAVIVYAFKPYWEDPVSNYVDLSFLDPLDAKVETVLNEEAVESALDYTKQSITNIISYVSEKAAGSSPPDEVAQPELEAPATGIISIHNIEIGTSEAEVKEKLGDPVRTSVNEYGTEWLTFHENYQNFIMLSYDVKRRVNAIYTNDRLIASSIGIEYGVPKAKIRESLGEPISEIRKGTNIYKLQDDEGMDVFHSDGIYMYVFYDLHKDTAVTAVQLISDRLEQGKTALYAPKNDAMRKGFEMQLFDLTNAARVRHGRSILTWDQLASETARLHSTDMAVQDYFSHENLKGESPFDRMKKQGVKFVSAGENLAYGQSSSIFAHEGLMNSKGHRENILIRDYQFLGIGVDFNDKEQPFYTENFFAK